MKVKEAVVISDRRMSSFLQLKIYDLCSRYLGAIAANHILSMKVLVHILFDSRLALFFGGCRQDLIIACLPSSEEGPKHYALRNWCFLSFAFVKHLAVSLFPSTVESEQQQTSRGDGRLQRRQKTQVNILTCAWRILPIGPICASSCKLLFSYSQS